MEKFLKDPILPVSEEEKRIFQSRYVKLAQRRQLQKQQDHLLPVLTFTLGGQKYGLPASYLHEVHPVKRYTPLPGISKEYWGVVNIRGEVRVVLDLEYLLQLQVSPLENGSPGEKSQSHWEEDITHYILFCKKDVCTLGIRVDEVDRLEYVEESDWQHQKGLSHFLSGQYVSGIIKDEIILLNMKNILQHSIFKNRQSAITAV